jgi:hypothetical protein
MSDPIPATLPRSPLEGDWWECFEHAWRSWRPDVEPPRWSEWLPGPGQPCDIARAFFLIQLDIEYRVQAGLPALLAEPYGLHPRLGQDDARLTDGQWVELIQWEYQLRWQVGQRARRADFQAAFPRLAGALDGLFPRWVCADCRQVATSPEDEAARTLQCPGCGTVLPVDGTVRRSWTHRTGRWTGGAEAEREDWRRFWLNVAKLQEQTGGKPE